MSETPDDQPTAEATDPPTPDTTPGAAEAPEAAPAASDAPATPAAADTPAPAPDAPAAAAPPAPVAAVAVAEPEPAKKRGSVQVPVWLLVVLTVAVVGVAAFFVGRETAPESSDTGPKTLAEAVEQTASGQMDVGDFDVRALLQAIGQNRDLDLGSLGELILGQGGRN